MVIDFHTHVLRPDAYLPEVLDLLERSNPAYRTRWAGGAGFPSPAEMAADLRDQGVAHAVVLAEHAAATSGDLRSEWVAEYCSGEHALIPACCVNPNADPHPRGRLAHYLDDLGMRVLKLLPSYNFFRPDEARMYRLYELCAARGVPVLIHVGSSVFPGTRARYCDPAHLQDVARDFPELPLVLAHAGRGYWYEQCAFMASHEPNVYLDLAGLPPASLPRLLPTLERLARDGKVVFGSDWPAIPRTIGENVAALRALDLDPVATEQILSGTARRLLGLPSAA
jgi:uncharacterized protein